MDNDKQTVLDLVTEDGTRIDFGAESVPAESLMLDVAGPMGVDVPIDYIRVVRGAYPDPESGKMTVKLDQGNYALIHRKFLERCQQWHNLEYVGKEWRSNHQTVPVNLIKKWIADAIYVFGFQRQDVIREYQALQDKCRAFDSEIPDLIAHTAAEINSQIFEPPPFIVDQILPVGLTFFGARKKSGKSFIALDLAVSVATGRPFWGFKTTEGEVLYLDLEGNLSRTQNRLPIVGRASGRDCPEKLEIVYLDGQTKIMSLDNGLVKQLEKRLDTHPDTKLIIVDVVGLVRGRMYRTESEYDFAYRILFPLKKFATERKVSVLCVTHLRKGSTSGLSQGDPFDDYIGSSGQAGATDANWVLRGKFGEPKQTFSCEGREVKELSLEIERNANGRWICNGSTAAIQERTEHDEYLQDSLAEFIRNFLPTCGGRWTCEAKEILEESARIMHGYIELDALRLAKHLRQIAPQLLKYDGITVLFPENSGRKGRKYIIKQDKEIELF